jgi:hypothetical protein
MYEGLIGVILGALLTGLIPWIREWRLEHLKRDREARYLAVRVVCILDRFIEECAEVVIDDGLDCGQPNPEGELEAQVDLPIEPAFPNDVDWKSINRFIMYEILSIPSDTQRARRRISGASEFAFPPDYKEFFEERQYQFACIGLKAAAAVKQLRETYEINGPDLGRWNPLERMRERKALIEQERQLENSRPSLITQPDARALVTEQGNAI